MKIHVFGADGLLGKELVPFLSTDHEVKGGNKTEWNILDAEKILRVLKEDQPQVVINAAAYTDVDGCEKNREKAFTVNGEGPKNIAWACRACGAKMIHFSTDYIFDGLSSLPYKEMDSPNPLNIYGASKLMGEQYIQEILSDCLIIRTEWLYGRHGRNFVDRIIQLAREKEELKIVNDQQGAPTHAKKLTWAIGQLLVKEATGILHVTNSGCCTWFELARRILEIKKIKNIRVVPISSQELQRLAKRPSNSLLDCSRFEKITGCKMVSWQEALEEYLSANPPEENH